MNQITLPKSRVRCVSSANLPTMEGFFVIYAFQENAKITHKVLVSGKPSDGCLVRVHSECATGDIFGSRRCDCQSQLQTAMRMITAEGSGVVVYMKGHEGRGIGFANKLKAYKLQDEGFDTVDANLRLGLPEDARQYGAAADILKFFNLVRVRLLTNNKKKIDALEQNGITVQERVSLWPDINPNNQKYIETKIKRTNHIPPEYNDSHPPLAGGSKVQSNFGAGSLNCNKR